jgi:hypothetical protein
MDAMDETDEMDAALVAKFKVLFPASGRAAAAAGAEGGGGARTLGHG